jgi:hypothetical protein
MTILHTYTQQRDKKSLYDIIGRCLYYRTLLWHNFYQRFYGVMVSTLDSESSDPSSNLGKTLLFCFLFVWGRGDEELSQNVLCNS